MSRRIEVELTSKVDDDTWTWRAAGARLPKGTLAGKLLFDGAAVGQVVRAEVENDIDGIVVLAIFPPKEKAPEPERIQMIPPPDRPAPSPSAGPSTPRGKPDRERPPRAERPSGGGPRARPDRPDRPDRRAGAARPERGRDERRGPRTPRPKPEAAPERPKHKRLSPGHTHRNAVLDSLPPEQRPIAEHLLRGGIPAVRQAIDTQNTLLESEKQSTIKAEPLLALAEGLLPRLKAAEWRDRAEAAAAAGDDLSLRDLRSVVSSAEARDDASRLLVSSLREKLDGRLASERDVWVTDITDALTAGRVVRALRIASRPPDPAMRFPPELGGRLSESAGAAMAADAPADRWLAVLDAVAVSPVRRSVKPIALPAEPSDEFMTTVKQAVSRVPALGPLVGIEPPKPPPPPPSGLRLPPKPTTPPPRAIPQRPPPGAAAPVSEPPPEAASESASH